jgi:hypothetical protein
MDGPTLYAKLDAERRRRERENRPGFPFYSWGRVSRESGVPYSTIWEYKRGRLPRAKNLARLLGWIERASS